MSDSSRDVFSSRWLAGLIPRRYRGGQVWNHPHAPRGPRFLIWGMPLSLLAIMALTILVEAVLTAGDYGLLWGSTSRGFAYLLAAFHTPLLHGARPVFPGQDLTMFASYAFLHGGPVHLIVNMVALTSFGMVIVQRIGQKRFVIAYLLCAIGGAAGFALLSSSTVPMVGASGALFGLVGIWVCWDYLDRRHYGDPLWVTLRAVIFLVLYNLVFFILLHGSLAWQTHLGGFVTGWCLAIYWGRRVLPESRRRRFGTDERPDQ